MHHPLIIPMEFIVLVRCDKLLHIKSKAVSFYTHLLNLYVCDKLSSKNNLICRTQNVCVKYGISFIKYIIDDKYALLHQRRIKNCFPSNDGVCDSVRQLLLSNDPYDRTVLNMMLLPF